LRLRLDEPPWWYGEGPGIAAALAPLAAVYGWAARRRFTRTRPYCARLPVVCVGNLTAGGTGKTPLTLDLCGRLRAAGRRPALLARAAPTMVSRDRAAGARAIEGAIEAAVDAGAAAADVIVMDDGLQNPQLAKDLTLAVVDGRRGLGNGRVLPAGPLRAPLAFQLGLVDALIVNAPAAAADGATGAAVAEGLRRHFAGPILRCATVVDGDAAWLQDRRVVAWAGIGAPQRFFEMLRALGAECVETVAFGDHERLGQADAQRLLALAARQGATLLTTAKDMARLTGATADLAALAAATRVLPIALRFAEPDAAQLAGLIDRALRARS
jgi:tetraacyldisaccharide 4'-kinase